MFLEDDEDDGAPDDIGEWFEMDCASRGFHVYRRDWSPKLGQKLATFDEQSNVYDPYAMALTITMKSTITGKKIVGHIPRQISRFCKFFVDYGGEITGIVKSNKYRRSPILQGGLEIPIKLVIGQGSSSDQVFQRVKQLVNEYYIEPERISVIESNNKDFDL